MDFCIRIGIRFQYELRISYSLIIIIIIRATRYTNAKRNQEIQTPHKEIDVGGIIRIARASDSGIAVLTDKLGSMGCQSEGI
jgi:hypothetical protein